MRAIFVGGVGRSGTTLLGSLLGGFEGAVVTPESQFKVGCILQRRSDALDRQLPEIWQSISQHWRFKAWSIDVPDAMELLDDVGNYEELILYLVERYAKATATGRARLWIDHTPSNIRYAPLLKSVFGDVGFVHIIRDGRGVYASVRDLDWGPNTPRAGARWWARNIAYGLSAEEALGTAVVRVRFEDLVCAPDEEVDRVIQELEASAHLGASEAVQYEPPEYTQSQHKLVGREPVPSKATDWEERLSRREIMWFEYEAWPILDNLGYEPRFGIEAEPPGRGRGFINDAYDSIKHNTVNRVRRCWRRRLVRSVKRLYRGEK